MLGPLQGALIRSLVKSWSCRFATPPFAVLCLRGDAQLNQIPNSLHDKKDGRLSYCLYRSSASPGIDEVALDQILEKARVRNRQLGLSGCLHYENGTFFQWLEGPPSALYPLLSKLQDDGRHINFTILDQGPLERRIFDQWQMRFSDKKVASLFDWIMSQNKAEHSADDYADDVQAFMRSLD